MNNQPTCVHDPKKSTISLPLQTILSPHACSGMSPAKNMRTTKTKISQGAAKNKKNK